MAEETEKINVEEKPKFDLLETVRAEREKADKVLIELRAENDRKERLIAEEKLGGITSGRIEDKPKIETPLEYKNRILSNRI